VSRDPGELLVEPDWLEAHLDDPSVRIVDASWYLPAEKIDGRAEYLAGHIPGAIYLDLSTDLADPSSGLRNTVARPEALGERLERAGIGSQHRVVVYDRRGGFSAGRVWWVLRYAGHTRNGLLDGGFTRWMAEGRPVTRSVPELPRARFRVAPEPRWLASKADVVRNLSDPVAVVVDARSRARFRGEGPEPAKRRGHVPGSVNVPQEENLDASERFRDLDELRRIYAKAGVRFDRPVITTCGSGVTAALDAFALTLLGHPEVAVYDGSWDEWGNSDDVPVA
jgi:thiosulfate/3-mercaptopyruvate sulfurtransferase